jgi:hypothetical protein
VSYHFAGEPKAWSVTGRRGDRSNILNRPDSPTRAADDRTAMRRWQRWWNFLHHRSWNRSAITPSCGRQTDEATQLATDTLNWQYQSSRCSATMDLWIQAAQDHEVLGLSLRYWDAKMAQTLRRRYCGRSISGPCSTQHSCNHPDPSACERNPARRARTHGLRLLRSPLR